MRRILASSLALSSAALVIACGATPSSVRTDGAGAADGSGDTIEQRMSSPPP